MNTLPQPYLRDRVAQSNLAIVCPMANEQDTAERFVTEVLAHSERFKATRFFAILDSVCKDQTLELLNDMAKREPRLVVVWAPENRCVVDAYVRGYREAVSTGFEWILEIDAGFSHQPSELSRFVEQINSGDWDCVFGSRFCKGGTIKDSSLKRKFLSWTGTKLSNVLLGTKLRDMTSGFQMFRREVLSRLLERGITSRGHFFQTEMKFRCHGLRICEVPISYRAASPSVNSSSIKDALSVLWKLFRERTEQKAS
jgi:dolichol-phosphate mannosyltransferase